MVRRRAHRAHTVVTGRQAARHRRGQTALPVTSVVDALEEDEGLWIRWCGRCQRVAQRLDRHMRMADDIAPRQLLRRGVTNVPMVSQTPCKCSNGRDSY